MTKPETDTPLLTDEFEALTNVFDHTYFDLFAQLDDKGKATVSTWLSDDWLSINIVHVMRPDIFKAVTARVFSQADVRDFVMALTVEFFIRWSVGRGSPERLARSLAEGLLIDGPNDQASSIPDELSGSFARKIFTDMAKESRNQKIELHEYLLSNRYFMVLLLLYFTQPRFEAQTDGKTPSP